MNRPRLINGSRIVRPKVDLAPSPADAGGKEGRHPQPDPLLSVRTALVMLLAVLVGLGAGVLTMLGEQSWPAAVMAGGAAAGASLLLFNNLIG